jgi:hypothetical protein
LALGHAGGVSLQEGAQDGELIGRDLSMCDAAPESLV